MKKNGILLIAAFLMAAGLAQAQDGELHGSLEVTYLSKFIWRGFDVYNDKSAIQPAVNLDLGSGWGLQSQYSHAGSDGFENLAWWRNYLYYRGQAFADAGALAMNYQFGYYYYNFPDNSCDTLDLQEVHGIFSFPGLLGGEVIPTLAVVKLWPAHSGQLNGANNQAGGGSASGWAFIPMLDYGLPITCPITGEQRTLNLHYEMVYNDGVSPAGGPPVDHDWSNAVFGISTDIAMAENVTLTPAVYYQSSWEDTVNTEDEFWGGITLRMGF